MRPKIVRTGDPMESAQGGIVNGTAVDQWIGGGRLQVQVIAERIFRVRFTLEREFGNKPSWMVVPQEPSAVQWRVEEDPHEIVVATAGLRVRIRRGSGAMEWRDGAGNLLVRELERWPGPGGGGKQLEKIDVYRWVYDPGAAVQTLTTADGVKSRAVGGRRILDRQAFQTRLSLVFSEGEAIYGLGQHEEGILNYRGKSQTLYQQNMKVAMPVIVSSRGWGILFDSASLATFHDDEQGSYFWTQVDDDLEFYFVAGPEFDRIVSGLRQLTGKPTMLPRWALGYVQSKERYFTQQELIDVTREFRARGIPLDCIVQDWHTWVGELWGDKTPDPSRFSDVAALSQELHDLNTRLMVSIWPIMRGEHEGREGRDHVEMRDKGFLLGNDATYDAFQPAARALYWAQANRGWFSQGIDAWWCDCTEPFEADWTGAMKPEPWMRVELNTGEAARYLDPECLNAYSMVHSQGIYEHWRASGSDKRVVNLTRSGYPGQHRYGTITWSGDISALWETLRRQIADGLNFCVTGNPRWTLDVGGFFVGRGEEWFRDGDFPGGVEDPGYRELYVRWLQFGAFLPMFRSHGTDTPREPWRFGEKGERFYEAILACIRLRYRLLPYLYSIMAAERLRDYTMMRMLAFDFREDARALNVADQFMCGPALLVCPVTRAIYCGPGSEVLRGQAESREVYLPGKRGWYDFYTEARHESGQTIIAAAPLERAPLFVRAGSIVVMRMRDTVHSGEGLEEPLEVRVYPGADGTFVLYEDAGDGFAYEAGAFAETNFQWNDEAQRLRIGPRRGTYAGMAPVRAFCVRVAGSALQRDVEVAEAGVDIDLNADRPLA
jgi:alpha-D-xyloside xylohydrolase